MQVAKNAKELRYPFVIATCDRFSRYVGLLAGICGSAFEKEL